MQHDVRVERVLLMELHLRWEYLLALSARDHRNSFHVSLIRESGSLEYKFGLYLVEILQKQILSCFLNDIIKPLHCSILLR